MRILAIFKKTEKSGSQKNQKVHFIDIAVLAKVFRSLWCPLYRYGRIVFEEEQDSKRGFASLLPLECASIE